MINHKQHSVQHIISLNIDPTTAGAKNLILFAEANLETPLIKLSKIIEYCYKTKWYRLNWVSD